MDKTVRILVLGWHLLLSLLVSVKVGVIEDVQVRLDSTKSHLPKIGSVLCATSSE